MGNSGRARVDDRPYFFLSYAHTPWRDPSEGNDPDYWVAQLFRDLSRHMSGMLGLLPDAGLGFMDREMRLGNEWPHALAEALATCRVFVPLYSRRYFASAHCGKEWSAFARRVARYPKRSQERPGVIVPALWVRVDQGQLPEVARHAATDFDGTYAEHGFYGIMKLTRYRDEYEDAVYRLARRIVAAGEDPPLPPGAVEQYEQLENAFGPAGEGERRVLIAVAALDSSRAERTAPGAHYGETPLAWTPYPDDSKRPLAEEAASLATSLGFSPEVGELAEHSQELVSQARPTRAIVLIVDPWAATVPELREILRRIDRSDRPWISVVVASNPKDSRTAEKEKELRRAIETALPHKLVEGRVTSALAIRGAPSLADFGVSLSAVLREAERSYLRSARDLVVT